MARFIVYHTAFVALLCLPLDHSLAATISGHVFRADTIAASQFSVTFTGDDRRAFTAITDRHGGYRINQIPAGHYNAATAILHYGTVSVADIVISDDANIDFHVDRHGKNVMIKVHHDDHDSPSMLKVFAQTCPENRHYQIQAIPCDNDYCLPLDSGCYRFNAEMPGWTGSALQQSLTDDQQSRTVHIYGTVGSNPALQTELLAMLEQDQRVREHLDRASASAQSFQQVLAAIREMDEVNQARFRQIMDNVGWPDANAVGLDGTKAAFFLLQHGPYDAIASHLSLLQQMADAGQLSWQLVAMSIDRVLVSKGEKQLFGSQFTLDAGHRPIIDPIDDEAHLEERRRLLGLVPFDVYMHEILTITGASAESGDQY